MQNKLKDKIIALANELEIDDIGFARWREETVVVFVVSYFAGNENGNISRYARGEDYHHSMRRLGEPICRLLEDNGYNAKFYCDASPLPERYLALQAELGVIGKNQALIHPKFGSYIFIGCITTNAELVTSILSPLEKANCLDCGKCIEACPSGALSKDGFNHDLCVSYLTQKKGDLTDDEKETILKSGYLWGCDVCQEVCPMNKDIPISKHKEFTENLMYDLPNVDGMSNKEFLNAFPLSAFTWRGRKVIERNIKL